MSELIRARYSFLYIALLSAILVILIFLYACTDKPRKIEMTINVEGKVIDISNDSPMANVEVQIITEGWKVLRTTETNEEGQYTISYYGKCNRADPGTTLYVRSTPVTGYFPEGDWKIMLLCTEEIQTFDFRFKPQSL